MCSFNYLSLLLRSLILPISHDMETDLAFSFVLRRSYMKNSMLYSLMFYLFYQYNVIINKFNLKYKIKSFSLFVHLCRLKGRIGNHLVDY